MTKQHQATRRLRARASRPLAPLTAVIAALALPASAPAHTELRETTPDRDATLREAPARVQLRFEEPIEASFGAVRVLDPAGERVDRGELLRPSGRPESVAVRLREGLERGAYTVTYRVVSADGDPVSGGFAFGVRSAATAAGESPAAGLREPSEAGPVVEGTYGVVRGFHYGALLVMIGAIAFWALIWRREEAVDRTLARYVGELEPLASSPSPSRWPGRLLLGAVLVGGLTALAGIALQGAVGAGVSLERSLDPAVLEGSLSTRAGQAWALRAGAWSVLAILLADRGTPSRRRALALALPVGALVLSLPLAGHARTQSPQGLLVPIDLIHVVAAGTWLGALVLLLVAFWPGRGVPDPRATAATRSFSTLALPAVLALLAAGLIQAWFHLGSSLDGLFSSAYGLALSVKLGLLAAIVAVAAENRRRVGRLLPLGGSASPPALKRAMRGEVALAVLVLAATAVLVRETPPTSSTPGPEAAASARSSLSSSR